MSAPPLTWDFEGSACIFRNGTGEANARLTIPSPRSKKETVTLSAYRRVELTRADVADLIGVLSRLLATGRLEAPGLANSEPEILASPAGPDEPPPIWPDVLLGERPAPAPAPAPGAYADFDAEFTMRPLKAVGFGALDDIETQAAGLGLFGKSWPCEGCGYDIRDASSPRTCSSCGIDIKGRDKR